MDQGYKRIFWGVFLASFNITLGVIKIVPAFAGWMVVLSGINHIRTNYNNTAFNEAAKYNKYLIGFSLLGSLIDLIGNSTLNSSVIFSYYAVIPNIFELLMLFKIIEGSIDYLKSINEENLSLEFEEKQRTYTIFEIITIIGLIISLTIYNDVLMTITALMAIILRIYIMTMMGKLRKVELKD